MGPQQGLEAAELNGSSISERAKAGFDEVGKIVITTQPSPMEIRPANTRQDLRRFAVEISCSLTRRPVQVEHHFREARS